jgi:hypothetical protein
LQSPDGLSCQKMASVDCLSGIAFQLASSETGLPNPSSLTARYLAGAGQFTEAYALANRGFGTGNADMLYRIALQEVLQATWAKPNVAADLSPLDAAASASSDPKGTMLICLRMVANELSGAYDEVDFDSAVLSSYGQGIVPRPPIPRATIDAILARWGEIKPGSPGPVSVLLALGDRQSAIKETTRLVSDPKMLPHSAAEAWAEVGQAELTSAIEDASAKPRAAVFIEAAKAMRRFGQPSHAVTRIWKRALFLLTEPVHDADYFISPRQVIDGIAESSGRKAAMEAANAAAERSRVTGRRTPFLLAGIAAAYVDLGDPAKGRLLLGEAIAALGSNRRLPSYIVILMYRLGDHAGFDAAMAAFGDDQDPRWPGSSSRGEVWTSLIRETDVDPTLAFVTHGAVGRFAIMKSNMLMELAIRRMQQGRHTAVPQLILAIAEADKDLLAENNNDFFKTGAYQSLAAAGQLSHILHDRRGAAEVLRVMIDAAFANGRQASWQLAQVASFWHRRLPELARVP